MFTGPNTITDGLVLALDAGNTKSFKGEPTTNLFSSPQFTTQTEVTVGDSSITKINFGEDRVGIQMIQTTTANIVGFSLPVSSSTPTSGATYTVSAQVFGTQIGSLVKSQITVDVNGIRYWLTNSNTWTTTTTESNHLFKPTQVNNWHKFTTTFTMPSGTLTNFTLGGFYRTTSNFTLKIANVQLEAKAYATPFVNGTRGTTVATGGGWADKSGNNNHGELVNGPIFDSENNGSIVFDGVNDYLSIDTTNLNNLTEGSVEFWFQSPNTGPIFSFFTDVNNYFTIWTGDSTGFWIDESIRIIYRKGGTYYYNYTAREGNSYYADNNWHHCVFTVDSSGNNLYTNGALLTVEQWSLSTEGNASSRWLNDLLPDIITFGRRIDNYTNVGISSAKIYNKALSAQEVLQNYNATKSRFNL